MEEPRFDPGGFFEFDLANGTVKTREGARIVMFSEAVVGPLVSAAVRAGDVTAIRSLGHDIGKHARASLQTATDTSIETVLGHAASSVALFGWGRMGFERWGQALIVTLQSMPQLDAHSLSVAALLGGLLTALHGEDVACVPISKTGSFAVVHPTIAEQVWSWAQSAQDVASVVARLQRNAANEARS